MPEIQALALRVEDLSRSVDFWNQLMIWGLAVAAIAAVFIVVATRIVVSRTGQLSTAQDLLREAKDRQLQVDLGQKGIEIGNLKVAADAAEGELSKQKERTANAEKAASDAALALAKFKQPRSLSPEQQDKLVVNAEPFAGQNFAFAIFPDPEPQALARVIDELLKSAGWKRVPAQIQREGAGVLMDIAGESAAQISDSGIDAYIAPDDQESVPAQHAFCSALRAAGIHCENHRTPQLAGKTPRAITISVGKKP